MRINGSIRHRSPRRRPEPGVISVMTRCAPGRDNWNLALFKSFIFSEDRGTRLELRAESFNTWNHTQFKGDVQNGGISTSLGSGNFGTVTNAYDPRVFQLGIKLYY
ncbi:MAG TPA: hypothetical protein VEU94_06520 [Terriglobales bacterium]|nr:hypothetical protein [Terriglobales bacterium]